MRERKGERGGEKSGRKGKSNEKRAEWGGGRAIFGNGKPRPWKGWSQLIVVLGTRWRQL